MIHPLLAVSAGELVGQLAPAALAGVLYARRSRTLAGWGHAPPRWRQACFYGGLATLALSLTALDHVASVSLSWHVTQQLVIGEVASLLLVLGLTAPLLAPLRGIGIFERLRVLANPLLAFPLWAANLYLWHLPALYQGALEHSGVNAIEHICFLAFGINMWMCLFGPLAMPRWFGNLGKLLYVVAVRLAGAVLANIFLWSGTVSYPFYRQPDSVRHISPLVDENVAGAIMMVVGTILTLGLFGWLFTRTLADREQREVLLEHRRRTGTGFGKQAPAPAVATGRAGGYRRSAARHSRQDRELGPVADGSLGPF
jgi:cytochrome c oxidase assembly factor CtaG